MIWYNGKRKPWRVGLFRSFVSFKTLATRCLINSRLVAGAKTPRHTFDVTMLMLLVTDAAESRGVAAYIPTPE